MQERARRAAAPLYAPPGYHKHHWSYRREHWCDVIALPADEHARLHGFLRLDRGALVFRPRYGRPDQCPLLDTKEKHVAFMARVLALPRTHAGGDAYADAA